MSKFEQTYVIRAEFLKKTLGTRVAAGFLRNRGYTIERTLEILCPGAKVRG